MTDEKCFIERNGKCILKDETVIVLAVTAFTGLMTGIAILNAPILNGIIQSELNKK